MRRGAYGPRVAQSLVCKAERQSTSDLGVVGLRSEAFDLTQTCDGLSASVFRVSNPTVAAGERGERLHPERAYRIAAQDLWRQLWHGRIRGPPVIGGALQASGRAGVVPSVSVGGAPLTYSLIERVEMGFPPQ